MATSNALFEAPASHEAAAHYANPEFEWEMPAHEAAAHYSNPELEWEAPSHEATHYANPEFEWEAPSHEATHYANPEFEWEASSHEATHYSNPELEWEAPAHEAAAHYSNPELEWEAPSHEAAHYSNPEFEWEMPAHEAAAHYSNPELEWEGEEEGEFFFKQLRRGLGRALKSVVKIAGPIAKRLAPFAAKALIGMIPGVGAIAGPLAGQLVGQLVKEGEAEATHLEAEFFGTNAAEAEVAHNEAAHEAALTEVLAAQAAEASNESEAEAAIGASLPLTITIMGGRRALRPVMPVLAAANARLGLVLRRRGGPAGANLQRLMPTIQRRTIATLRAASRAGQPITAPLAVRAFAASARRTLGNPRTVARAIVRNVALRQTVAPPHARARRNGAAAPLCARCMGMTRRA